MSFLNLSNLKVIYCLLPFVYYYNKVNSSLLSKILIIFIYLLICFDIFAKLGNFKQLKTWSHVVYSVFFSYVSYLCVKGFKNDFLSTTDTITYFLSYMVVLASIYINSQKNNTIEQIRNYYIYGLSGLILINWFLFLFGIYNLNTVVNGGKLGNAEVLSFYGYNLQRTLFYFSGGFSSYSILCAIVLLFFLCKLKSHKQLNIYELIVVGISSSSILLSDSRNGIISVFCCCIIIFYKQLGNIIIISSPFSVFILLFIDNSIKYGSNFLFNTARSESILSGRESIWLNSMEFVQQNVEMFIVGNGLYGQAASGLSMASYAHGFSDWNTDRPEWASLHNNFFQFLTDIGIVGAIIIYILLLKFALNKRNNLVSVVLMSVIIIGGFVDVTVGLYDFVLFITFFLLLMNNYLYKSAE